MTRLRFALPPLHIRPLDVLAYATLPRVIPRLKEIGFRFTFVAQMMALLYAWVGLLPYHHPYLSPQNAGAYSVRQVLVEAARHLEFKWKYVDRIVMFFVLLAGFVMLAGQFMLMFLYLAMGIAHAAGAGAPFVGIFTTPNPTNDIAFIFLDRVFGVPGIFNSCISLMDVTCEPNGSIPAAEPTVYPEPFQIAMQSLFAYYSMGALMVGGFIVCYFIGVVILESMQTGVPFGKRFATFYAPIRLCLAVLALVPLPIASGERVYMGYNTAQYLTLYVAKWGSGLGTNGWNIFNNTFVFGGRGVSAAEGYSATNPGSAPGKEGKSPAASLIARPHAVYVDTLVQFMYLSHACRAMAELRPPGNSLPGKVGIAPYLVNGKGEWTKLTSSTSYATALAFSGKRNIKVRFGMPNGGEGITPFCGELSLRVGDLEKSGGASWFLEQQYHLIANMWENEMIKAFGDRVARIYIPVASKEMGKSPACDVSVPNDFMWGASPQDCERLPSPMYFNETRDAYQKIMDLYMVQARDKQIEMASKPVDNRLFTRGWAGAGIWYNRLAELNGSLFEVARALPDIAKMPAPMLAAERSRREAAQAMDISTRYLPFAKEGVSAKIDNVEIAAGLGKIYEELQKDAYTPKSAVAKRENIVFNAMQNFFGLSVLFSMRENMDINPMVQLLALGKSIVDAGFYNLLAGGGIEFVGGMMKELEGWNKIGGGVTRLGDAWFKVATISLGIGIVLFYVMPFLPFLYFFFSVIKWLKSIFEAMVGVPMWALAHLRIDGDGIPGKAGSDGYFLLLEIFLRPILTIFGLVASMIVFMGMVYTLNDVFDLLSVNLAGYTPPSTGSMAEDVTIKRGTIDQFFYTVVYAVLVYMIAMSSFKLIDLIPSKMMRWGGAGNIKNLMDQAGDPMAGMVRSFFMGTVGMPVVQEQGPLGQAIGGLRGLSKDLGGLAGKAAKPASKKGSEEGGDE